MPTLRSKSAPKKREKPLIRVPWRSASAFWWLLIIPSLTLCLVLAFWDPYLLGRVHPSLANLPLNLLRVASLNMINPANYALAVYYIGVAAIVAHVVEALMAVVTALEKNVEPQDAVKWVISVFILGFPQLTLFNKGCEQKRPKPKKN